MSYQVKAVIFDQDGLMFDTERLSVQAWNAVGEKYGIKVTEEFFDYLKGSDRARTMETMKSAFPRKTGSGDFSSGSEDAGREAGEVSGAGRQL